MYPISQKDRDIVRTLAKQVAEIAALPEQQETKRLWKALNALKPVRPMIMIDQIPWHEMNVEEELTLQCEDSFCRGVETTLRRKLYSWKHMRADMVVEPFIEIPKVIRGTDFGIHVVDEQAITDSDNDVVGHYYVDQLQTEDDLQKIRMPVITLDEEATVQMQEKALVLLDGILEVHMQGCLPGFAPWDSIAQYRGVQNILYDLVDRPEFLHQTISRLTAANLCMLDQLEAKGLLGCGQSIVHCSGAYTDELPAPGYNPGKPRAKDLWTCGMAQMFSTVSPAMHEEFDLEYAVKWYSRFGLVYYGCCEPLHTKMNVVRKIPNLRKISMSPWVDVERGAREIGKDYVFSSKPSPAFLAGGIWEPEAVEKDLRNTLEKCTQYQCPTEFILKDISTVQYKPQRLWEWVDMAMRMVGR
jgi:hypothetical protein